MSKIIPYEFFKTREKLPNTNNNVLMSYDYDIFNEIFIGSYKNGQWFDSFGDPTDEPEYWAEIKVP